MLTDDNGAVGECPFGSPGLATVGGGFADASDIPKSPWSRLGSGSALEGVCEGVLELIQLDLMVANGLGSEVVAGLGSGFRAVGSFEGTSLENPFIFVEGLFLTPSDEVGLSVGLGL